RQRAGAGFVCVPGLASRGVLRIPAHAVMPGTKRDTRPRMLYLASQSPRRRELLGQLGVDFTVLDTQVPEQRLPGEAPGTYVRRVARAKAAAGLELVRDVDGALVLGADTDVVL